MRLVLAVWLLAGRLAAAPEVTPGPWDVGLYLVDPQTVPIRILIPAESLASKIIATAGVRLDWDARSVRHPGGQVDRRGPSLIIKMVFTLPSTTTFKSEKGLAYTYPYDENAPRVIIAYSHLSPQRDPQGAAVVLAHTMAHEITHVLQRIDRHSDSGLMKAHWNTRDYGEMKWRPLSFEPVDLELIEFGRASWQRVLSEPAGMMSAQNRPTVVVDH